MTHAQRPSVDSEMHELNAEADLLDQKITVVPGGVNGEGTKLQAHSSDSDAQAMVIESLRNQVQDLFSQVTQLNNKLVRSYDRVSDLEDEIHVTSSNLRQATLKISQLELERTQHLSALSTGLLVEKSHVTAELTRLMEKATEEAARRGQAETARAEIEKDLDDLSAGLFGQANTMVAEARIAEARSARKLEETEAALRSAEEVVGALQSQMQALQSEKEKADRRVEEMRIRMGKGKWIDRFPENARSTRPRLLASHVPYHEFLIFVSHLRAIRPASAQPPAMSNLLPLPFLARLVSEDSDPTVRLDLAPSLNWLSRRSVLAAIHSGQLTIEPMQFTTLMEELAPPNIPASSHNTHIVCALCGISIYSTSSDSPASTPTTPNPRSGSQSALWSTSLFKNVRASEIHNRYSAQYGAPCTEPPSQLHIFRLDSTSSGLPVSLPISSQQPGTAVRQAIYPLCTNGWCLYRLRTTCSLWAFVRTSIVEKIWEEPPFTTHTKGLIKSGVNGVEQKHDGPNGVATGDVKPTTTMQPPPRRTKMGLGSLWGSMQRSLSGAREPEKDAATAKEAEKKEDTRPKLPPRDPSRKTLPPAPPAHPSVSHASKSSVSSVYRVPPPLKASPAPAPTLAATPVLSAGAPPPLPKRNRGRETSVTPEPDSTAEVNGVATEGVRVSSESVLSEPKVVERPTNEVPEASSELAVSETSPAQDAASVAKEDASKEEEAAAASDEASANPKLDITIPTSISRATSNDSFSTPTEELALHLGDTPVAATVPLPASQEQSAVAHEKTSANESAPSTESSASTAPAAAASTGVPAPAPGPAVVPRDDKPPSRTGSPAPPPLPRRAAARTRPSSTLVPQAPEVPKHDSVDVPPLTEAATEEATTAESPSDAAPQDGAMPPLEPILVTAEPEQITQDETLASAADEGAVASDGAVPLREEREPEPEPAATVRESQVNGDALSVETESVTVAPDGSTETDGEKAQDAPVEAAGAPEVPDNGQYVGEATWEERTFKELARLREEMFWARIGAVH